MPNIPGKEPKNSHNIPTMLNTFLPISHNVYSRLFHSFPFLPSHVRADAPIMGHMLEYICNAEAVANPFDETSNCAGEISDGIPPPQRMKWDISQAVRPVNVLYCIAGSFGGILSFY